MRVGMHQSTGKGQNALEHRGKSEFSAVQKKNRRASTSSAIRVDLSSIFTETSR